MRIPLFGLDRIASLCWQWLLLIAGAADQALLVVASLMNPFFICKVLFKCLWTLTKVVFYPVTATWRAVGESVVLLGKGLDSTLAQFVTYVDDTLITLLIRATAQRRKSFVGIFKFAALSLVVYQWRRLRVHLSFPPIPSATSSAPISNQLQNGHGMLVFQQA